MPGPARRRVAGGLLCAAWLALTAPPGCSTRHRRPAAPAPARPADAQAEAHRLALAGLVALARGEFRPDAAMALVQLADRGYRTRGNAAFVAVQDAVAAHLAAAGFGADGAGAPGARVARETLAEAATLWDPRAASIELLEPEPERLQGFDPADDAQRTMLVAFSDGGDVRAEVVRFRPDAPAAMRGRIVLTDEPAGSVAQAAARAGARAVLSAHVEAVNAPDRHPDAIRYELPDAPPPPGLLLLNLSPASAARLRAALARGRVVARVRAEAAVRRGRVETLVARIDGRVPGAAPVVVVAHADEPGANDNGSGVGAVAEAAAALLRLYRRGDVPAPARPIVFLFGMEIEMSSRWLDVHPEARPLFALSVDMAGEPPEMAPMLIERTPDPGALRVRPPDAHTAWGHGRAPAGWYRGSFLNGYAMAALHEVEPAWAVRDHPYEGGSDHVPFLARGVPAVLLWHFPDDAYHTSRDRLARVSAAEVARVGAGVAALLAHGAASGEREGLELVALTERYAHARLAREKAAARRELERAPAQGPGRDAVVASERAHLGAWARWFDQALASCERYPAAPLPALGAAVAQARARVGAAFARVAAALR